MLSVRRILGRAYVQQLSLIAAAHFGASSHPEGAAGRFALNVVRCQVHTLSGRAL